jgi:rubrerythrin
MLDAEEMSRIRETTDADPAAAAEQVRQTLTGRHVCPFCGQQNAGGPDPCPHCTMEDTPATRQATKARIGPWYVLQSRNPAAPGMRYAILLALINKGQITPRTIIRGPTTHQLWRFAAHVRGISREFALCYSCGGAIERSANICPHCQRPQEAPVEADALLESRPSTQMVPIEPAVEQPASYAARMRELNRHREQGLAESQANPARQLAPRRPGGRVVSAMELAAALQDGPSKIIEERPKRNKLKIAFLVFVLLVGAAAAAFYLMPDYREPTVTWLNTTLANAKAKLASINWPKSAGLASAKPAEAKPAPERLLPYSAPIAEPPQPQVEVVQKPAPTPSPAVVQAVPQPDPVDPSIAIDQARRLWSQAIDSEARQDFAGAVKKYQQIKQLPNDAWPAGLQLRMEISQRRAAETSAQ